MNQSDISGITARLKREALARFDSPVPDSPFAEIHKTFNFLHMAHAVRGNMFFTTLPMELVQDICTLMNQGFELSAGAYYEGQGKDLEKLLDRIWSRFTQVLLEWTHKEREDSALDGDPLFYGCFQIPDWFVEAAQDL